MSWSRSVFGYVGLVGLFGGCVLVGYEPVSERALDSGVRSMTVTGGSSETGGEVSGAGGHNGMDAHVRLPGQAVDAGGVTELDGASGGGASGGGASGGAGGAVQGGPDAAVGMISDGATADGWVPSDGAMGCTQGETYCEGDRFFACGSAGEPLVAVDCAALVSGLTCKAPRCTEAGCAVVDVRDGAPCGMGKACVAGACVATQVCTDKDGCKLACVDSNRCQLSCVESEECVTGCSGSSQCTASCDGVNNCEHVCQSSSSCQTRCQDTNNCAVRCEGGADCAVQCTDVNNCDQVSCNSGASCLLQCDDVNNCGFASCSGMTRRCPGNVLVCNRDCP